VQPESSFPCIELGKINKFLVFLRRLLCIRAHWDDEACHEDDNRGSNDGDSSHRWLSFDATLTLCFCDVQLQDGAGQNLLRWAYVDPARRCSRLNRLGSFWN